MKLVIVFASIVAVALSLPRSFDESKNAEILRYNQDNIGIDGYNFGFETSDGVSRSEQAHLKNIGTEDEAISVRGTFSYVGDDGVTYIVNYVADENGFQPEADHLPKA